MQANSIQPFESAKFGKEGKKYKKFKILTTKRVFFRRNKKHFS